MYDLEKIRRLTSLWVKENIHRQNDAYTATIYFLLSDQPSVIQEGVDLLNWSLNKAIILGGCGRHVIPHEDKAREQIEALIKHQLNLLKVLTMFKSKLFGNNLPDSMIKETL